MSEKDKKAMKNEIFPHNLEAEQSVLGCILIDLELQSDILSKLNIDDFYLESHKIIFEGMNNIFRRNKPVDFVTLADELEKTVGMEVAGGISYLTGLTRVVPSAANYNHYFDIVKRDSVLRKLIRSSQNIIDIAISSSDKNRAVAFAEKEIYDISASLDSSNLVNLKDTYAEVLNKFDAVQRDKNAFKGLLTGFTKLDELTNGLQRSDLVLIAARPAMGKTSLAMNIVEHIALYGKATCAVFSLEMPKAQIAQRMLCSVSNISMSDALKGKLSVEKWKELWKGSAVLSEAKIFVDDSSLITPAEILSKCRRLKSKYGLDLIMIDYIQLMNAGGNKKDSNRQQEVSEISRNLKIIAKELNVPVIALSQLSRAVEARTGHRPQLSDLRESGAIEQDADIVMFIHRADVGATEEEILSGKVKKGLAELIVAKHRNGGLGTVELMFKGESTKFVNIASENVEKAYNMVAPPEQRENRVIEGEMPTVTFNEMPKARESDIPPETDDDNEIY